jgi:RNA polymerase sigma-70 factor (ECF subfamily)
MNSEAAAYFPDALANASEVREAAQYAPEIPSELLDQAQSASDLTVHPAATVVRISEISDELLLEQVREGAKEALGVLFRRHAHSIRNVAYRILRNEAEADDLVQEVFLFIFRKATLFDIEGGAARSWIFQVAYHRAFDRRRYLTSRHFYSTKELDDTAFRLADHRQEPLFHELSMEGIFGKELTARFNARLTAEQRETIQLFFFEGYALKEIAELTGRSLVNVRNHYYRGLERFRKYVLPEKMRSR